MLKDKFQRLFKKYSSSEELFKSYWQELESKYTSKNRHYHNLTHLENMLIELEPIKSEVQDLDTLLFSIFYHDIIYKSTRKDNEYQSALLFKKRISETSFLNIEKSFEQIIATKAHQYSDYSDTNILLDLDLSILGQPEEIYNQYCQNIRKEYSIYPDLLYFPGRKKVLRHFLELDSIFKTSFFIEKYEESARANIEMELQKL